MPEEFKARLDYTKFGNEPLRSMYAIERYLHESGISRKLLHMMKFRASQINGCAYCIDMHWKDARAAGETDQRLYGLDAWRESPYYTEKERAALDWTEALTLISETHAPDEVYERVRAQFSEKGIDGSDAYRRHDQHVESHCDFVPRRPWPLSVERDSGCRKLNASKPSTAWCSKFSLVQSLARLNRVGVFMSETQLFFDAIRAGDLAAVCALLDQDSALLKAKNAQSQSPVLFSIYNRQKEIRDLLLSRGAQMELHEAAAAGDLPCVKELADKDASLAKSYSPDGFPVLALASVFGHFEVTKYLHTKGGDVNAVATNGSGYNALTGAVASGHTEIVRWLLDHGAEPNYRYATGYTPLLTAAANGHLEILKELLAHGADLSAKSNDGKNALAYSEERNHKDVAAFLLQQGLTRT